MFVNYLMFTSSKTTSSVCLDCAVGVVAFVDGTAQFPPKQPTFIIAIAEKAIPIIIVNVSAA
jgi:hypothetical protein